MFFELILWYQNHYIMKTTNISQKHKLVIKALKKEDLTSFQIQKKVKSISLILVIYNIIDDLKSIGILRSYIKNDLKYYHLS